MIENARDVFVLVLQRDRVRVRKDHEGVGPDFAAADGQRQIRRRISTIRILDVADDLDLASRGPEIGMGDREKCKASTIG